MRNKIIAGNWKMNTTIEEGSKLLHELLGGIKDIDLMGHKVLVIPPFTHLPVFAWTLKDQHKIALGAQNCSSEKGGAYTGEVSVEMLKSVGVHYIIIGHSERRQYFHETNALLNKKVKLAIEAHLTPIYCCGETLEERESGKHFDVIKKQITDGLIDLSADEFDKVVIAYEPVWAIGTGKTASPAQANEIHGFIRELVERQYDEAAAQKTIILYGGSMNAGNAKELLREENIDGGLIGGASLKPQDFISIIKAI